MTSLTYVERQAARPPHGALVLHHGRGADQHDLIGLADLLDPERRLHVVTPGGPLTLPGLAGRHWYVVPRVGHPDPVTFGAARDDLAALHDELWERTGLTPQQTVLGGFSMGTVMSYAMALGEDRPAVAGVLAFSGFIPTVDGWLPALADRQATRAFIAHGRNDPVIGVEYGRRANEILSAAGLEVSYHESGVAHRIDPLHAQAAIGWLRDTII